MGQQQLQIEPFQQQFNVQGYYSDFFLGEYKLLKGKGTSQQVIKKSLHFNTSNDYQQFSQNYTKIQRKPFNLIYPLLMLTVDKGQPCTGHHQVHLYFENMTETLGSQIRKQGPMSEGKAWFLLNQISKSLQLLSQNNRAHWHISPETIFLNSYQNYFIFDSYFVIGPYLSNFLQQKRYTEPVSEQIQRLLGRGAAPGFNQGAEEDMYCLGLTIIYVLTQIHPRSLPRDHVKRRTYISNIFQKNLSKKYSKDLIQVLLGLVQADSNERMTIYQLRRLLHQKQSQIIKKQNEEFNQSLRLGSAVINRKQYKNSAQINSDNQRSRHMPINLNKSTIFTFNRPQMRSQSPRNQVKRQFFVSPSHHNISPNMHRNAINYYNGAPIFEPQRYKMPPIPYQSKQRIRFNNNLNRNPIQNVPKYTLRPSFSSPFLLPRIA